MKLLYTVEINIPDNSKIRDEQQIQSVKKQLNRVLNSLFIDVSVFMDDRAKIIKSELKEIP